MRDDLNLFAALVICFVSGAIAVLVIVQAVLWLTGR